MGRWWRTRRCQACGGLPDSREALESYDGPAILAQWSKWTLAYAASLDQTRAKPAPGERLRRSGPIDQGLIALR